MRLLNDERGSAAAYLAFLAIVIIGAIVWIALNEFVLYVGDWVATTGTEDGGTWAALLVLMRMTPIVILISAFTWAIVRAHKGGIV